MDAKVKKIAILNFVKLTFKPNHNPFDYYFAKKFLIVN